MKLILSAIYDSDYTESGLKYESETKRLKSDLIYLQMRNALSSHNSYTIIELLEDNPNQIIKCVTPILNFENWDNTIYNMGNFFIKRFHKKPQILTVNQETLNKLDQQLNIKTLKDGSGNIVKKLDTFECSLFSLKICINEDLPNDYISIIHDEQAEFSPNT